MAGAGVRAWRLAAALTIITATPGFAAAQGAADRGWTYSAKLTAVWAAGNSESSTFGLGSTLRRLGDKNELKFESGGIRTESSRKTRRAIGTPTSFDVEEDEDRQKTAEAYFLRGRYDRTVSSGSVVFAGADWLRNTFAGIDSRMLIGVGAGNVWKDTERFRFKTDYSVTYTFQEDVVDNPFVKSNFPGARVAWDLRRTLTNTTKLESVLTSDLNFNDTDDVRVDFINALSLTINSALALKPSLQLLWRNQPALTEMDLFTPVGTPTGQKVRVPLEKLDSFFTLALVITL